MKRFRFSMATLMGLVGLFAVGLAALKSADSLWGGLVTTFVLGVLLFAILGFTHNTGPPRRFWSGFALFGWAYLVFIFAPWFANHVGIYLPTESVRLWFYSKMARAIAPTPTSEYVSVWLKSGGTVLVDGQVADDDAEFVSLASQAATQKQWSRVAYVYDRASDSQTTQRELQRFQSLLTSAGILEMGSSPSDLIPPESDFRRVVHFLTALIAGLIGGLLARLLIHRPDIRQPQHQQ